MRSDRARIRRALLIVAMMLAVERSAFAETARIDGGFVPPQPDTGYVDAGDSGDFEDGGPDAGDSGDFEDGGRDGGDEDDRGGVDDIGNIVEPPSDSGSGVIPPPLDAMPGEDARAHDEDASGARRLVEEEPGCVCVSTRTRGGGLTWAAMIAVAWIAIRRRRV